MAAGGDVGEVGLAEGERFLALCSEAEFAGLGVLTGGDADEGFGGEGAK